MTATVIPLSKPDPPNDFIMFELLVALAVEIHKRRRAPSPEEIETMVRVLQSIKGDRSC